MQPHAAAALAALEHSSGGRFWAACEACRPVFTVFALADAPDPADARAIATSVVAACTRPYHGRSAAKRVAMARALCALMGDTGLFGVPVMVGALISHIAAVIPIVTDGMPRNRVIRAVINRCALHVLNAAAVAAACALMPPPDARTHARTL